MQNNITLAVECISNTLMYNDDLIYICQKIIIPQQQKKPCLRTDFFAM